MLAPPPQDNKEGRAAVYIVTFFAPHPSLVMDHTRGGTRFRAQNQTRSFFRSVDEIRESARSIFNAFPATHNLPE